MEELKGKCNLRRETVRLKEYKKGREALVLKYDVLVGTSGIGKVSSPYKEINNFQEDGENREYTEHTEDREYSKDEKASEQDD